ncbi:ATP-binding cassette domain-containing protein [Paenibacillus solanacearum]|uniref:ATP-binding cassette domain-containing protein n=1 Tax=Paenibacillus solanacearum TaxID=2048548 RepID=UPI003CCE6C8E
MTSTTFHLEHQTIKRYAGNYAAFRSGYEQSRQQLQTAYDRQQKEMDRLELFIQKNRVRKAKQAKSREKMLERIERIEKPAASPPPRFAFPFQAGSSTRVAEVKQLWVGYDAPLFGPVDLHINRGDKIAIVGSNGIGKSTMLKTLLGRMKPASGTVRLGEHVLTAYYAQERVTSDETPLEKLTSFRPDLTNKEIRQKLAFAGLNDKHIRQPLNALSGGEQAKVRLCELMLTSSNVLVLDEPTNHLDTRAKEALKEALKQYPGTILLVSHEPAFYEDWVTRLWQVEEWYGK